MDRNSASSTTDVELSSYETDSTTTSLIDEPKSSPPTPLYSTHTSSDTNPNTTFTTSNLAQHIQYINDNTLHVDEGEIQRSSAKKAEELRETLQTLGVEMPEQWLVKVASDSNDTIDILLHGAAQDPEPQALETVGLSSIPTNVMNATKTLPEDPLCITQELALLYPRQDPTVIMVGNPEPLNFLRNILRWKYGSVIKWTAMEYGYYSKEDAYHAASSLKRATYAWNNARVGVTFKEVKVADEANFILCYGGDKGTLLAKAYFPNNDKPNFVLVYRHAFQPGWKENLWKVFTHELGHILGLRHEFAMDDGPRFEGNAVRLGMRNHLSVMNYRGSAPPEIQQSDIDGTRFFYSLPAGTTIFSIPIVDFVPK